ncbi:MAG: bifunctional folylpolyglutamate synthase/dihydrofolate synthase [Muribaculaceae bacterium]|nr:bifunctional folylpolyglutamate synthase/dihydrofolate synthase [Muribaculaceae bacterium]
MNYKETTEYLFSQVPMFQDRGPGAYKPGLGTTIALAEAYGNPHNTFTAIHVAGTNGKGSTSSLIAATLQSAGYRTALYTSPHLTDFRERMRINGEMIPESYVVEFVEHYLNDEKLKALQPSFFELTTIMAFSWFAQQKVDVAVIEVGLGGRLDSTNIITPILSIITNISLDHTALLGHTEPEIAREKAGIIKAGVPVVIGQAEGDVMAVFKEKAEAVGAPLYYAQAPKPCNGYDIHDDYIAYHGTPWGDVNCELTGGCQPANAFTAFTAIELIQQSFCRISAESVREGFRSVCELTGLVGRWMKLASSPISVICDTGHNIGGWHTLGPALQSIAAKGKLNMVVGFVNDKDVSSIVQLMPKNARYYFARPSVQRGRDAESTAETARGAGLEGKTFDTVAQAYEAAMAEATEGDTVFVGGSTFVVADLLAHLKVR